MTTNLTTKSLNQLVLDLSKIDNQLASLVNQYGINYYIKDDTVYLEHWYQSSKELEQYFEGNINFLNGFTEGTTANHNKVYDALKRFALNLINNK